MGGEYVKGNYVLRDSFFFNIFFTIFFKFLFLPNNLQRDGH